jgi:penicillin-binding protein 1A
VTDQRPELANPKTHSPLSSGLVDRLQRTILQSQQRARDFARRRPNAVRSGAALVVALFVFSLWFLYQVLAGLPGRDELRQLKETAEGTTIYDMNGQPVFSIPTQYRVEVPLSRISPRLRQAIIAVEDARFYQHDGMDAIRVVGALFNNLRQGRPAEGASTITQQLARISFLSRDKTLRRKLREAILAQRIEHLFTKDDILEIYLNKVYFGDGLYGAEAAARGYFGKSASELTLAEAAMLAGIVRAPSASNPTVDMARAIARRNVVLKLMRDHHFINRAERNTAMGARVTLRDDLRGGHPSGLHFKEVVNRQLLDRFGRDAIYTQRLRVYTTIDPDMQKAAEAAVVEAIAAIETRIRRKNVLPLQASLLALDPASGEVRAIVGGRDPAHAGFHRAIQAKRQPGSAFKPFIYAAALESGYSPATVVERLNDPVNTFQGAWLPEDEHSTADSMTLRAALRTSSNRAAVRMIENVGIERTVSYAGELGVGTLPTVPSVALGSGEVSLASLTAAYGAFAREGIVRDPVFIRRVEDHDGRVLMQADPRPRRVISEETAFLMTTMLADVIESGTAISARSVGFTLPAAGKTGTTNKFVDAWFVGFTPKLLAGVWVGFDQPHTIVKNGFAGQLAVPLWARFMMRATQGDPPLWFNPPADIVGVEVCRLSGQLPSEGCRHAPSISPTGELSYKSMVYSDYFMRGREPLATCLMHQTLYEPYPEPYFSVSAFDGYEPLFPAAPVFAPPVPTSGIDAVATSGIAPRRAELPPPTVIEVPAAKEVDRLAPIVIDVPVAPPPRSSPESVLPPPEPPEPPPVQ